MPNNQALQVFYGTVPLILAIFAIWARNEMLLKDILARLGRLEKDLADFKSEVHKDLANIRERLVALETRAGIIYHN